MKKRPVTRRALLFSLALIVGATLVFADHPASGRFDTVMEVTSSQGTRSMPVTIEVVRPMSLDEALSLRKVLETAGQQALANAIRGSQRGRLLLGAVAFPLDIVVAEKTDDGWSYIVVTARDLRWNEIQLHESSAEYPFAVAEFEVSGFGRGSGTLTPRASLSIGDDGLVSVASYEGEAGKLKDVKRR